MTARKATAEAGANVALLRQWGSAQGPGLSMTLDALRTTVTVAFDGTLDRDRVVVDGNEARGRTWQRAADHLDRLRALAGANARAHVEARSTIPAAMEGARLASALAALSVAASAALRLAVDARALSRLARQAFPSAGRSLFGGFVVAHAGDEGGTEPLADARHWGLRDVVAVVAQDLSPVPTTAGQQRARSSRFHPARMAQAHDLLAPMREAVLARDLLDLGPLVEADALATHFVMMSSQPPLFHWTPATLHLIRRCHQWREQGLQVYFSLDAGPHVHLLCEDYQEGELRDLLRHVEGVTAVVPSGPGGPPTLQPEHLF